MFIAGRYVQILKPQRGDMCVVLSEINIRRLNSVSVMLYALCVQQ